MAAVLRGQIFDKAFFLRRVRRQCVRCLGAARIRGLNCFAGDGAYFTRWAPQLRHVVASSGARPRRWLPNVRGGNGSAACAGTPPPPLPPIRHCCADGQV